MIPLCDLRQQYNDLKDEIDEAMQQVAADSHYILGPNVKAFEKEMVAYCGAQFAVGVGSGTDALHIALRALKIGPGDEVITTPFTFIGTTEAICMAGAKPVFVDIDPRTFNIDPEQIEAAVTPRTRAILPVHLYGQPCAMDRIVAIADRHGLDIVEDCAQSIGATYRGKKVGTFGKAGCFSFFPSKNLGCFGDGGMILTDDPAVYERAEMLRRHGGKVKYYHTDLGMNSRLDEIQAAILRVKLAHLDRWNEARNRIAERYTGLLTSPVIRQLPNLSDDILYSVFHQYTILTEDRDEVAASLQRSGIGNAIYYPVPLHLQQVYESLGHKPGSFPHAELAANSCLSLPMFPHLEIEDQAEVSAAIDALAAEKVAA